MSLPLSVLLSAIVGPLGLAVGIGTAFAQGVVAIYQYKNLNPNKLYFNEIVNKYYNSDKATQYKILWVKSDGTPVKAGAYQYAYCTIG